MNLPRLKAKAEHSRFYRWLLSYFLNKMVPFNGPHRFVIQSIGINYLKVRLPFVKRNKNHLNGLHACALATLCEISSGFLLISKIDPKRCRIILKKLEMEYHYQAKKAACGYFEISDEWMEKYINKPLQEEGVCLVNAVVEIKDEDGQLIATGMAQWQLKNWDSVKTKT